jgi:REP element-mobilizing transposase RayT
MGKRNFEFEEGGYYHIFNRGTDKRKIFIDKGDMYYFFDEIIIANSEEAYLDRRPGGRKRLKGRVRGQQKFVKIIAYALMPNHFHLIVTPVVENGVSKFMQKLGTSYTRFFNEKYDRSGVLFQGRFKAVQLTVKKSLEFMSVYINLNYKYHRVDLKNALAKTSLFEYLGTEIGEQICDVKLVGNIVEEVGGVSSYKEYSKRHSEYFTNQKGFNTKDLTFEELGE